MVSYHSYFVLNFCILDESDTNFCEKTTIYSEVIKFMGQSYDRALVMSGA